MCYFARLDFLTTRMLNIQAFLLVTLFRLASISRRFETPYSLRLLCQAFEEEKVRSRCQCRVAYVDESVSPSCCQAPLRGPLPDMDVVVTLRVVESLSVTCQ